MSAFYTASILLWKASLLSGTLYINGVRADGLRGFDLEDVDLRIDEQGDIHVTAPQYKVEVEDAPVIPAPAANTMIPAEKYWLVTVDDQSSGYVADVLINGSLVRKIRSGEEQLIVDVGPYLNIGENTVLIVPSSGEGGGRLHVYLGIGSNETGTVVIDKTPVSITLSSQVGVPATAKSSTFTVP